MAYLLLVAAILAEILGTLTLKQTNGFTRLVPTIGTLALYGAAFFMLARALVHGLDISVVYATWSGAGIAIITFVSITMMGEAFSPARLAGMVLVIAGVVTLNLSGAH